MNTITKLKKVKAEVVNDFEFTVDDEGIYRSDLRAKVSVRIINAVKEVVVRKADTWDRRNGKASVIVDLPNGTVKQLAEVGVRAEFAGVIEAYKVEAKKAEVIRNKAVHDERAKVYDKSWIHDFIKEASEIIPEVKIKGNWDKEAFIKSASCDSVEAQMTYRGKSVNVSLSCDGYSSKKRYQFSDWSLMDSGRQVWSSKPIKVAKKFKKLVDEKIESDKQYEISKSVELTKTNALSGLLKKSFGVETKVGGEYSRYSKRYCKTLMVVIGERELAISANTEMNEFNFSGIGELSLAQLGKIIKVIQ